MNLYSMKELRPLSLMEKKLRIEAKMNEVDGMRDPLVDRKTELQSELSVFNTEVRGHSLHKDRYDEICRWQVVYKKEISDIDKKLLELRRERRKLNQEKDELSLDIKKVHSEAKEKLYEVRDRYMSFAADTTRVSSMRAMASKFVEELQGILQSMDS
jgi:chromosome segregation ATPase